MLKSETGVLGWRVFFTRRGLPRPKTECDLLPELGDLDGWLDEWRIEDGSPYLIDPLRRYDVDLNDYFVTELANEPVTTQEAVAYDLKRFLKFLWDNRRRRSWKVATSEDRAAFKHWRVTDIAGPRVELTTWDREVATVNQFYRWAVRKGHAAWSPFLLRTSRSRDPRRTAAGAETPAEASHKGPRNDVEWLPPALYRQWRDVGVRGFGVDGLPDRSFRGRFASRNAAYSDLKIRTGLRLAEQTSLSLFELPEMVPGLLNQRSWLPTAIAKAGSARRVYFPASALKDVWDFVETDRAEAVEAAQEAGLYERILNPLIVPDRRRPFVMVDGERLSIAKLKHEERRRVLIDSPQGLEPAALWLNQFGLPSKPSAWQEVFKTANGRCERLGLRLRCHPHVLRHSFAVITLEQLWRGHIQELATMTPRQRETYQMIFGDPLNWVRMRLGHSSIEVTQIYLHTLQELEMETRMALVPSGWEPTGVHPEDLQGAVDDAA
ncbi:tyrosine-type recombinase/integrase [Streptomyces sp. NBC_01264]|uniref:tyrosine-type recombinase/integrase n=1 Tax=Streptomyces sp. NBC_01264 TaxID=2903804 RepID=UPI00225920CE|nr:site-specific integrase [Streptomyces sp. NBC_01264]MCX4776819.1 site-specific integrase [Streptomyces sp. NBC_01264]